MSLLFLRTLSRKSPIIPSILFPANRFSTATDSFPDKPTTAYYDDRVNAAGRERDFDAIRLLLHKRFRDGFFNTNTTFKFVDNTQTSLSALDDLVSALARLDDGFCRKGAFDALVARLCKLDLVDESLRVMDVMAREKYGINAVTYHPVLSCLTKKKRIKEAWRVIEKMRENGVSPDLTALNHILMAYCFNGDLTAAGKVMKVMEEEGLGADARTYDALVLGVCRAGKVEGAMVLLRRMRDDGIPALYSTHAHVFKALLGLGYYAQAVKFVMIYKGIDRGLDKENFGVLANRLIKLNRFEEAKLVLEEMEKMGLEMGPKLREFYTINMKEKNIGIQIQNQCKPLKSLVDAFANRV